jgi:GTP diphosphokinase / guanosine-3',5'-bis(diphosphate) 3'-diphosphatase
MATLREQIATTALTVTKFRELLRTMRANRPTDDLELVRKAYEYSQKNHAGQLRASGEPYLVHPLGVAQVLAEMKMDAVAIAAGLLHDSVEDTSVTIVDIRQEFGEQVAHIVEGVTKISQIDFATREEQQAENLRKMMLAMVDDIRVVLIKLADRLHNMRTLEHLTPERQQKIAKETLEIYGPIAHRLGMGKIRGELEDLGFRYLDPLTYEQVRDAPQEGRTIPGAGRANPPRQAERSRNHGGSGKSHQAPVQHPQETGAAENQRRPGLRPLRHASDYEVIAGLLRRVGHRA